MTSQILGGVYLNEESNSIQSYKGIQTLNFSLIIEVQISNTNLYE